MIGSICSAILSFLFSRADRIQTGIMNLWRTLNPPVIAARVRAPMEATDRGLPLTREIVTFRLEVWDYWEGTNRVSVFIDDILDKDGRSTGLVVSPIEVGPEKNLPRVIRGKETYLVDVAKLFQPQQCPPYLSVPFVFTAEDGQRVRSHWHVTKHVNNEIKPGVIGDHPGPLDKEVWMKIRIAFYTDDDRERLLADEVVWVHFVLDIGLSWKYTATLIDQSTPARKRLQARIR